MSRCMIFILIVVCCTAVSAADLSLGNDPCLSKPITLSIIGGDLSDVVSELSKQSGTTIRVTKAIADRKITILIDNKPLADVLKGIETLFGYRIGVKTLDKKKVYEFWEDMKHRQERDQFQTDSLREIERSADQIFRSYSGVLPSHDEIMEARKAFLEDQSPTVTSFPMIYAYRSAAGGILIDRLPKETKLGLLSGLTLCFDTRSPEPEWKIPGDIANTLAASSIENVQGIPYSESRDWDMKPDFIKLAIQPAMILSPDKIYVRLKGKCLINYKSPQLYKVRVEFNPSSRPANADLSIPYRNRLPQGPEPDILKQSVSITKAELAGASKLPWQIEPKVPQYVEINRSDLLGILHQKCGAQIISDHISEWDLLEETKEKTVKEMLARMSRSFNPQSYWGFDRNFLYTLSKDEYNAVNRETPNRTIEQIRQMYARDKSYSIDTLSQIALLGSEKAGLLERNASYLGLAKQNVKSFGINFKDKMPILCFYGSLNYSQRARALADKLNVSELSMKQKQYLAACVTLPASVAFNGSDNAIVVGMYKDGIRVDRPQSDPTYGFASVDIREGVEMPPISIDGTKIIDVLSGITITITFADGSSAKVGYNH